ncbi:MAG: (2Fe-2S)-binding protein [Spirochaetes bacterium]|nr:(2Fe-2S)-binding protein [Spirochaetota bacterium]
MTIVIDNTPVTVNPGDTVLAAARSAGINIPTMCHKDGLPHHTSCMVCVVNDATANKLIPSCTAPAADGMRIETATESVIAARKAALELLLSEHAGDCEAPCQRACPAHMDIPAMIRAIADGDDREAIRIVRERIALPSTLGRICPAPCEKVCRRKNIDAPVSICLLKRFAGDNDYLKTNIIPAPKPPTGKRIAVVGAGPAGLSAAYYLLLNGHACTVYETTSRTGGALYHSVSPEILPHDILEKEVDVIRALGAQFIMNTEVGKDISLSAVREQSDAVVIASGSMNANFGLAMKDSDISVTAAYETSAQGIFACGNAVSTSRMAIRSAAEGYETAVSVDHWLKTGTALHMKRRFNSSLGKLRAEDIAAIKTHASPVERNDKPHTAALDGGLTEPDAMKEAARCLHCDCRKKDSCRLRDLSESHQASQNTFSGERAAHMFRALKHGVVFEQGKCIKCGICVRICESEEIPDGFTFMRRGFDIRVDLPFGDVFENKTVMLRCASSCPTGAITSETISAAVS